MDILALLRRATFAFLLLRIGVFLLEWVVLRLERRTRQDLLPNLGCGAIVLFLGQFVTGTIAFGCVLFFAGLAPVRVATTVWSAAFTFVAADLCFYLFHLASHRVGLIWADHSVHHSSHEFDLSTNLRLSPFVGLYAWVTTIPLLLIGLNPYLVIVCLAFANDFPFFLHTTRVGKLPRPIEFIFNTPSHHRVHHSINPGYRDKNFGGIFIVWDRIFCTFANESEECVFGSDAPVHAKNPMVVLTTGWRNLYLALRRESDWQGRLGVLARTWGLPPSGRL